MTDVDVDLLDHPGGGGVRLVKLHRFDLAVGGDRTDEILMIDPGDSYLDQIAGERLDADEGEDSDKEDDARNNTRAQAACLKIWHPGQQSVYKTLLHRKRSTRF